MKQTLRKAVLWPYLTARLEIMPQVELILLNEMFALRNRILA